MPDDVRPDPDAPTKKDQILGLFTSGVEEVEALALLTDSRMSYVGSVLREAGLVEDYFDLYTSTAHPMNPYSKFFAGRLGFKDRATSHESVALIDKLYDQFARVHDRAGQHHAMMMALTMYNRARWTGKTDEAEPFRTWLMEHLDERR